VSLEPCRPLTLWGPFSGALTEATCFKHRLVSPRQPAAAWLGGSGSSAEQSKDCWWPSSGAARGVITISVVIYWCFGVGNWLQVFGSKPGEGEIRNISIFSSRSASRRRPKGSSSDRARYIHVQACASSHIFRKSPSCFPNSPLFPASGMTWTPSTLLISAVFMSAFLICAVLCRVLPSCLTPV